MVFSVNYNDTNGWCGRLIVSALVSGTGDLGSSPGRGHYDVLLVKTFHSHSAFLLADVSMGSSEFNTGVDLRWISITSRGK